MAGNYEINVTGVFRTNGYGRSLSLMWKVALKIIPPVIINTAPFFDPSPDAVLNVECNKNFDYPLPPIVDSQNDQTKVLLTTDVNGISQLAALKSDGLTIRFAPLCRASLT
jgi:hypothetical protein